MSITRAGTTSAKCNALQCETLDLGLEGFSECPQVGPNSCEFARPLRICLPVPPSRAGHDAGRWANRGVFRAGSNQGRAGISEDQFW